MDKKQVIRVYCEAFCGKDNFSRCKKDCEEKLRFVSIYEKYECVLLRGDRCIMTGAPCVSKDSCKTRRIYVDE